MTEPAPIVFHKVCGRRKCAKAFTSLVRHQVCCTPACTVAKRLEKQKARRTYGRERERRLLQGVGRKLAREAATARLPVVCQRCGVWTTWGVIDVHHIDGNPNNNPADGSNHANLDQTCHARADVELREALREGRAPADPRHFNTDGTRRSP